MTVSVSDLRPGPSSPNVYVDTLIYDRWVFRPGYTITYVLQGRPGDQSPGGGELWVGAGAGNAFRQAAQAWMAVANVRIIEVASGYDGSTVRPAGLTWVEKIEALNGFAGEHSLPGPGSLGGSFNNALPSWNELSLSPGGAMFATFVHEIGHGLGLKHPHPDSFDSRAFPGVTDENAPGDNGLNDSLYTIMSYNDVAARGPNASYGWVRAPMAFDIAAIQAIYGPNMAHATGSDVYVLPGSNVVGTGYAAIWDAGGIDTIAHYGSVAATIDLRPATLRNEPGGGGFLSRVIGINGGFTIAAGVVIENAIGGSGNDRIIGNDADNILDGGEGSDAIDGGAGNDTFVAPNGDSLDGGPGIDTIDGTGSARALQATMVNIERAIGTAFGDFLIGEEEDNYIEGREGGDRIWTGAGTDTVLGGEGDDEIIADQLDPGDVLDGGPGVDLLRIPGAGPGVRADLESPSVRNFENLIGSEFDDELFGTAAANLITAGAGNDLVIGRGGADGLSAGYGDDRIVVASTDYRYIDGGPGIDTLELDLPDGAPGAVIRLEHTFGFAVVNFIENVIGSQSGDRVTGSNRAERIEGRGGDDVLDGGEGGVDWLDGGEGVDTLSFAARGGPVILDLDIGSAFDFTSLVAFTGFERAQGTRFADDIFGASAGDDWILWSGGADRLQGGGGLNTLDFSNAPRPVIIDYDVRAAWDGEATATFVGFGRILGSAFDDTIFGSETLGERFEWSPGGDSIYGGGGFDILSYALASAAVIVDFNVGQAFDGASLDRYSAVEGAVGSAFDDRMFGSETGHDLFDGGSDGADLLYGGGGVDTASWAANARGVTIDLAAGEAWDGVHLDRFSAFENIIGSAFDDVILGDAGSSTLDGGPGGRDRLAGGAADDWFVVRPGDAGDTILDFTGGLAGDRILLAGFDPGFSATLEPDGQTWRIEALGGAQLALVTILGPVLPTDWVVG